MKPHQDQKPAARGPEGPHFRAASPQPNGRKRLMAKGYLQDPALLPGPHDDEMMRALKHKGTVCLTICTPTKCLRAGRCLHVMPLAVREHRHKLWPDWKERGGGDPDIALCPVEKLPRLPRLGP
jgi:hypothetical protein